MCRRTKSADYSQGSSVHQTVYQCWHWPLILLSKRQIDLHSLLTSVSVYVSACVRSFVFVVKTLPYSAKLCVALYSTSPLHLIFRAVSA